MPNLDASQISQSNMENVVESFEVMPRLTDGVSMQKETTWTNPKASQYYGWFLENADLKSAIIMKAIWNVGKGYTADPRTTVILDHISGWGKDTFLDILFNMEMNKRVYGDAYAEIIRDGDEIINLKVLDPASMRHVVGRDGRIKRFEQINKLPEGGETVIKFDPKDIFYLANNRFGDQIHGTSDIESVESTLQADADNFRDLKKIMHRQARPLIIFKLKTDNASTRDAIIAQIDKATNEGENVYIPDDENIISYEVIQVNVSELIMGWNELIRNKFYRVIGLPQVVPGAGGQSTESESKVIYLAFEQIVERDQKHLEDQIWNQLALRIELNPPASMQPAMQSDINKDAFSGIQPSDTTAGVGR